MPGASQLGDPGSVVNPVDFLRAASAFTTLVAQQDQHLGEVERLRVENLLGAARQTWTALARMTIRPDEEGDVAAMVFDALLDDIEVKSEALRLGLAAFHRGIATENPVRELAVARHPWPAPLLPDPDSGSLDHVDLGAYFDLDITEEVSGIASARDWAEQRFAAYFGQATVPARVNPAIRALSIAGFLQSRGGFTDVSQDTIPPFATAQVRLRREAQDEDVPCTTGGFSRFIGVSWCFRSVGTSDDRERSYFDQVFMSRQMVCETDPNRPDVEQLFRVGGFENFFESQRIGCGGLDADPDGAPGTLAEDLRTAIDGEMRAFTLQFLADYDDDTTPGQNTDLRNAVDELENSYALLRAYVSAAMPITFRTNEALVRMANGGLLDGARDPVGQVSTLYANAEDSKRAPYLDFDLSADIAILRQTLSDLVASIGASGISEPEVIFFPVVRDLEDLLQRL